jgi:hypothetical protein
MAAAACMTFVFAGYCTLKSDNEIGTAAAYATGLFFAVVAYTGRMPRIKIGENELDPVSVAVGAEVAAGAAEKAAQKTEDPKEVAWAANRVAESFASGNVAFHISPIGPTHTVTYANLDALHHSWMAEPAQADADRPGENSSAKREASDD